MKKERNYPHSDLTRKIIGVAYKVYNKLGYGFLVQVYRNAMAVELKKSGMDVKDEHKITVYYDGEVVGDYKADLIVDDAVIIELKSVETLLPIHEAQLVNYLKATGIEIGLLINFGKKVDVKRKIFTNTK